MKLPYLAVLAICLSICGAALANPARRRKTSARTREEKGYRHESVSHALATIERLGQETGLWTQSSAQTRKADQEKLEYNAKNLNDFDAVFFFTAGELEMDAQQKADLLSFVHDDGKGSSHPRRHHHVHGVAEYGKMIGAILTNIPGNVRRSHRVEDPNFSGNAGVAAIARFAR